MTSLTLEQQRIAKRALSERYFQHQIAAFFGCNQGRISEFKNSPDFMRTEPVGALPAGFPHRA